MPDHEKSRSRAATTFIPTPDDLATLRHVPTRLPWIAYTLMFVEMCERLSYCGTMAVFVNYIQQPLPPHSDAGAGGHSGYQSGALGMGQRASTAITTFDTFWCYVLPLLGGYVADAKWGKFKTILWSCGAAIVGHVFLVVSAAPAVLAGRTKAAVVLLIVGILVNGVGTGGIKANISPLIAEQFTGQKWTVKTTKTGERVILDYDLTIARMFSYFYLVLNVGAVIGATGVVYAEKYIGFWLSFLIPTAMYLLCPIITLSYRKQYVKVPPSGSVLSNTYKLWKLAMASRWSWNPISMCKSISSPTFWDPAFPSNIEPALRPSWMTFPDAWVHEVIRGLRACKIFLWYPIYWLSYNQMNNNLTSQAATLNCNGIPNDFISNINPFTLIVAIPIFEHLIFPGLRRCNISFPPLRRVTVGFLCASLALTWAAVLQYYIYRASACGNYANGCAPTDINVWWQTGPYALIGVSEILAVTSGMEFAFMMAPQSMKSLVMAVFLVMAAVASVLAQIFVVLSEDPLLVWNYVAPAVLLFLATVGFWWTSRELEGKEARDGKDVALEE